MHHHFQQYILQWYDRHGRDFPWRHTIDPYKILISEVMSQQTQIERVIPKYQQWIELFPDIHTLARADQSQVLITWSGLGYNRRAKMLHTCAQQIVSQHDGYVPSDTTELKKLAGIGDYTASAIGAFAFDLPVILIDTNVRSVYIYHFFPNTEDVTDRQLMPLIEDTLYRESPRLWYSALLDYGSMLKKLVGNPAKGSRQYQKQSTFKGSRREVRGQILKKLTESPSMPQRALLFSVSKDRQLAEDVLHDLLSERLVFRSKDNQISLKQFGE